MQPQLTESTASWSKVGLLVNDDEADVDVDMSVGRIWIDSIFIGGGHKRGEATAIEGRRAYSPCVGGQSRQTL